MSNKWESKYYEKINEEIGVLNLGKNETIKIFTKLYIDIVLAYESNQNNLKSMQPKLDRNSSSLHYLLDDKIEKINITENYYIQQKNSQKYIAKINGKYFSNYKNNIWTACNEMYYEETSPQYIKEDISEYIDVDIDELYIDKKNVNHGKINTIKLPPNSRPKTTDKRSSFKQRKIHNTAIKYKDFKLLSGDKLLLYVSKVKDVYYMKYLYNGKRQEINKKLKSNSYRVGKSKSGFLKNRNGERIELNDFKSNKNGFIKKNIYKIFHKNAPFGVKLLNSEMYVFILKRKETTYLVSLQDELFNKKEYFNNNKDDIIIALDIDFYNLTRKDIYYIESNTNYKKYFHHRKNKTFNFFDENEIIEKENIFGYLYYKQKITFSKTCLLNYIEVIDKEIKNILEDDDLKKIFQKEINTFTFMSEDEIKHKHILAELLFKLRNSISHQDFKFIEENSNKTIEFQNEHNDKIKLLANISINELSDINNFLLEELNLIDKSN